MHREVKVPSNQVTEGRSFHGRRKRVGLLHFSFDGPLSRSRLDPVVQSWVESDGRRRVSLARCCDLSDRYYKVIIRNVGKAIGFRLLTLVVVVVRLSIVALAFGAVGGLTGITG